VLSKACGRTRVLAFQRTGYLPRTKSTVSSDVNRIRSALDNTRLSNDRFSALVTGSVDVNGLSTHGSLKCAIQGMDSLFFNCNPARWSVMGAPKVIKASHECRCVTELIAASTLIFHFLKISGLLFTIGNLNRSAVAAMNSSRLVRRNGTLTTFRCPFSSWLKVGSERSLGSLNSAQNNTISRSKCVSSLATWIARGVALGGNAKDITSRRGGKTREPSQEDLY